MPHRRTFVHQPLKFKTLLPRLQFLFLDCIIEQCRINHCDVGDLAGFQHTSIETEPAGKLAGETPDGLFYRHDGFARELGIASAESLRRWVKQARIDAGLETGPTTEELAEIKALRKEVADQQRTIEILKAATTFFAQEADPRQR